MCLHSRGSQEQGSEQDVKYEQHLELLNVQVVLVQDSARCSQRFWKLGRELGCSLRRIVLIEVERENLMTERRGAGSEYLDGTHTKILELGKEISSTPFLNLGYNYQEAILCQAVFLVWLAEAVLKKQPSLSKDIANTVNLKEIRNLTPPYFECTKVSSAY